MKSEWIISRFFEVCRSEKVRYSKCEIYYKVGEDSAGNSRS